MGCVLLLGVVHLQIASSVVRAALFFVGFVGEPLRITPPIATAFVIMSVALARRLARESERARHIIEVGIATTPAVLRLDGELMLEELGELCFDRLAMFIAEAAAQIVASAPSVERQR